METLNVVKRGHGPAAVFLHPMGLDHRAWEEVAARFEPTLTTVLVDLPGHGRSPRLPSGAGIPEYAAAVRRTLEEHGVERPIVIGGSFGGMIAMTLALDNPGRLRALVISACPHSTPAVHRTEVAKRGKDAQAGGMPAVVEATLTRWFTPGFRDSATVEDYRQRLLADDVEGWADGWSAISSYDLRSRLSALDVPTLCVAGTDDLSVSLPVMQELAAEIPGARIATIQGGPHMLHIERPDDFTDAVAAFMAEQARF